MPQPSEVSVVANSGPAFRWMGTSLACGALLGKGAYGLVFEVAMPGTTAVLKVPRQRSSQDLDASPAALREIATENEILSALSHCPYVVRTFGVVSHAAGSGLLLEKAMGSLASYLKPEKTCGEPWCILRQILLGLQFCHVRMLLHRDLKPQNLLVMPDGRVVLSDFGLAKRLRNGLVRVRGDAIYTLTYRCVECLLAGKAEAGVTPQHFRSVVNFCLPQHFSSVVNFCVPGTHTHGLDCDRSTSLSWRIFGRSVLVPSTFSSLLGSFGKITQRNFVKPKSRESAHI